MVFLVRGPPHKAFNKHLLSKRVGLSRCGNGGGGGAEPHFFHLDLVGSSHELPPTTGFTAFSAFAPNAAITGRARLRPLTTRRRKRRVHQLSTGMSTVPVDNFRVQADVAPKPSAAAREYVTDDGPPCAISAQSELRAQPP